jgi:hypothetical protein
VIRMNLTRELAADPDALFQTASWNSP